jgi:hypothetical protein
MERSATRRRMAWALATGAAAALALALALPVACGGDEGPCAGVSCSGQGSCAVWLDGTTAYCRCNIGWHPSGYGAGCEPNDVTDPCTGVTCSGHGACLSAGPLAVCTCDDGYLLDVSALNCLPEAVAADADGDAGYVDYPVRGSFSGMRADIVILVDNSGSMAQEQAALTLRFPELIADLVNPGDLDGDTRPDHPPVEDLNIGVITPDMGTMSFLVSTCSNPDGGDNGCFRNAPSPSVTGCSDSYPSFLSRNPTNAETYTAAGMAQDFTCIATLGTNGCGFEQQFKAMRKATTENVAAGQCNAGFLRPDALLALIFVTDETDCSVAPAHREMFDQERSDLGHLNIRCFLHPDFIEPVEDYVAAFRALKPAEDQDLLALGMIVGVPPDAAQCIGRGDHLTDCLNGAIVPAMVEQIDPGMTTQLIPSCNTSMGLAFPPVRFVQLAQAFGNAAYVDSICKSDWTDAIHGITDLLVERLSANPCLADELPFDPALCSSECFLLETLSDDRFCTEDSACPAAGCPLTLVDDLPVVPVCHDPVGGAACTPLKRDLGFVTVAGGDRRRVCLVRQAARTPDGVGCSSPTDTGWIYVPPAMSPYSCPEFGFGGPDPVIDVGSTAALRCFTP